MTIKGLRLLEKSKTFVNIMISKSFFIRQLLITNNYQAFFFVFNG